MFFFSGIFFTLSSMPVVVRALANVFPVRHFYEATLTAFNPNVTGSGFDPVHPRHPCAVGRRRAGHRGLEVQVDPIGRTVNQPAAQHAMATGL